MPMSLWLSSTDGSLNSQQKLIDQFATEQQQTGFHAHITLVGKTGEMSDELMMKLVRRYLPLELETGRVIIGESFFRSLYQEVYPAPGLTDMRRRVLQAAPVQPGTDAGDAGHRSLYDPHISLYYGDEDKSLKQELQSRAAQRLQAGRITCDQLQLVATGPQVDHWQILKTV